jgi:hypothetical protein
VTTGKPEQGDGDDRVVPPLPDLRDELIGLTGSGAPDGSEKRDEP